MADLTRRPSRSSSGSISVIYDPGVMPDDPDPDDEGNWAGASAATLPLMELRWQSDDWSRGLSQFRVGVVSVQGVPEDRQRHRLKLRTGWCAARGAGARLRACLTPKMCLASS